MHQSRDPQARVAAATADSRILSVPEASDYIDRRFAAHIDGITTHPLVSERHVRRLLSSGYWPCTRTPSGHLGISVADREAIWTGLVRSTVAGATRDAADRVAGTDAMSGGRR